MAATEPESMPPEILADLQAAVRYAATGQEDPETLHRIRQRAVALRQAIFEKHGFVEVAVPLTREIRDEE